MARRRETNIFSLSLLDCICCGFGALILFHMIIASRSGQQYEKVTETLQAEVDKRRKDVVEGKERLVELRNSFREIDEKRAAAQGLSTRILETLTQIQAELATYEAQTIAKRESVNKLKADVRSAEEGAKRLSGGTPSQEVPGRNVRSFVGDGDRQYLSGLKVGGQADLHPRRRLGQHAGRGHRERGAAAPLPARDAAAGAQVAPVRQGGGLARRADAPRVAVPAVRLQHHARGRSWRGRTACGSTRRTARRSTRRSAALGQTAPDGGTSLYQAFAAAKAMNPPPDNIILLTDGLPTQGATAPGRRTVSGKERLRHFDQALDALPRGVPVNVILFPMEGDPMASTAFWKLAMASRGSFMTPSSAWP